MQFTCTNDMTERLSDTGGSSTCSKDAAPQVQQSEVDARRGEGETCRGGGGLGAHGRLAPLRRLERGCQVHHRLQRRQRFPPRRLHILGVLHPTHALISPLPSIAPHATFHSCLQLCLQLGPRSTPLTATAMRELSAMQETSISTDVANTTLEGPGNKTADLTQV